MNVDDLWSMFLDSYFAHLDVNVSRLLELLSNMKDSDKERILLLISDGERGINDADDDGIVSIYCDVKGVDSTGYTPAECRSELEEMIRIARGALNGE